MLTSLLVVVLAAAPKVALLPLSNGEGITEQLARSVTDALGGELRNGGAQLLTQQDLTAVVSVERQKQLLGCSETSCLSEIAGALDVDGVVVGTLSRLGDSWLLSVQHVDSRTGLTRGHASRRKKGGSIDTVLDELPSVARELLGASAPMSPAVAAVPAVASSTVDPQSASVSFAPPIADLPPEITSEERAKLKWLTDGAGHLIATAGYGGPLLFGDARGVYAQRIFGGGAEGDVAFNSSFWDPRAKTPGDADFELRNGSYTLNCGKQQVAFKPLPAKEAASVAKTAKLYGVRWQRRAYALARDEEGNHYFVDQPREADDDSPDFRVYLGTPGKMKGYQPEVLAHDSKGDLFRIGWSRLKLDRNKGEAEWIQGPNRVKLYVLPVEDHARFVYTQLGAYKGFALGTPCDLVFK